MKQIKITCYENGNVYLDTKDIHFDRENLSVFLTVYFPPLDEFTKRVEWFVDSTQKGFITGTTEDSMTFALTYQQLLNGRIFFQGLAVKGETTIKYKPVSIDVRNSLNVLSNDESVTPSIAELLQSEIDDITTAISDLQILRDKISDLEQRTLSDFFH